MVSLWPSRNSESNSADASAKSGASGHIEMHGNASKRGTVQARKDVSKSVANKNFITSFGRRTQAGSGRKPSVDEAPSNRAAPSVPDLEFATTTVQANMPTLLKVTSSELFQQERRGEQRHQ